MHVTYAQWSGHTKSTGASSVEDYVAEQLTTEIRHGYRDDLPIEKRVNVLAQAFGRLCAVLIENKVLTEQEFFDLLPNTRPDAKLAEGDPW